MAARKRRETRRFDGFCLVSSDSDFTGLALRIREEGLTVLGFGEEKTPDAFRNACHKFIFTEILRSLPAVEVGEPSKPSPAERLDTQITQSASIPAKAPMNGVLGMTELLLDTELDQEQREYAQTAASSAQALLGLINDILDFSKIEAGELEIERIGILLNCAGFT